MPLLVEHSYMWDWTYWQALDAFDCSTILRDLFGVWILINYISFRIIDCIKCTTFNGGGLQFSRAILKTRPSRISSFLFCHHHQLPHLLQNQFLPPNNQIHTISQNRQSKLLQIHRTRPKSTTRALQQRLRTIFHSWTSNTHDRKVLQTSITPWNQPRVSRYLPEVVFWEWERVCFLWL